MSDSRRRRTDADPRAAALAILEKVESGRGGSGALLADLPERMPGRDRALATEIVYGVLRRRTLLDLALARVATRPLESIDPGLLGILRVGAYQILFLDRVPAPAAVDEAVGLARRLRGRPAAAFANAVLRAVCSRVEPAAATLTGPRPGPERPAGDLAAWLATDTCFPRAFVDRVLARHGPSDGEALLRSLNHPAPVVLRPTLRSGGAERLARRLADEGVATAPSPVLPGALRVVSGVAQHARAFSEGLFYIQDEAAQIVTMLLEPVGRSDQVVDLCAAPGGKILQVAGAALPPRLLLAADHSRTRLALVRENAARAGVEGVLCAAMDASRPALRGTFSRVLLDAPCSGTGVIRRHPEIRWRRTEESIRSAARRQAAALRAAAALVAPGGRLVYAVCSLEPEEGEDRVAEILRDNPALRLMDARAVLPPGLHGLVDAGGRLRTLPHRHDVDGFFAAILTLC